MKLNPTLRFVTFCSLLSILSSSCKVNFAAQEKVHAILRDSFPAIHSQQYKIRLITYKFYNRHVEEKVLLSENSALIVNRKGYFQPDTFTGNYEWQELILFFNEDPEKTKTKPCKSKVSIPESGVHKKCGTPVYLISLKGENFNKVKKYSAVYIFEGEVHCTEQSQVNENETITRIHINKHRRWSPTRKGNIRTKGKPEFETENGMTAIARFEEDKIIIEALIDNDYLAKGERSIMYDMKEIFGENLEFVKNGMGKNH